MEQTLGHVTHYRNLREATQSRADIEPAWLPIPFDVHGPARLVPVLRSNWSVRASWRARRALHEVSSRQPLDAVFFHSQVTALFSRSITRRVPSVVSMDATPVNYDSVGQSYGHRAAGRGFLDRRKHELNRQTFESATRLVTWSEWARDSLARDYGIDPSRATVLAPGAAPVYFEVGRQRRHSPPAAPTGPVRILFVGGDFLRKGGDVLLEALAGPVRDRCELHLVTQARVPSTPGVHVHNGIGPNSPELIQLFSAADIFVLPTYADCLPLVLMEAAAAALPVVTTNVGALSEAVSAGRSGMVVPTGDSAALSRALLRLAEDAELRRTMGQAGHALANQKFDARRNSQALVDLIVDVADRGQLRSKAA